MIRKRGKINKKRDGEKGGEGGREEKMRAIIITRHQMNGQPSTNVLIYDDVISLS